MTNNKDFRGQMLRANSRSEIIILGLERAVEITEQWGAADVPAFKVAQAIQLEINRLRSTLDAD